MAYVSGRPESTDLKGQTAAILQLANEDILTVYRRMDKPGLWANIQMLDGDEEDWTYLNNCVLERLRQLNQMMGRFLLRSGVQRIAFRI